MATFRDEPWLTPRACRSLAHGLDALGPITEAPLRVRGHVVGLGNDVFDVQEEFELGPSGRRFLVSVDVRARQTVLLAMGGAPGGDR